MLLQLWNYSVRLIALARPEDGQDLTEYAFILLVVIIALIGAVQGASNPLLQVYNYINTNYP